jgi:type IV pilus assembly protein PilE
MPIESPIGTRRARQLGGFTLIEMMITVAIIAILAAVALPSYDESRRKSRRADAKQMMMQAAQFMERSYTETNRYDKLRKADGTLDNIALPVGLTSASGYTISIAAVAPATFSLNATPVVGGPQNADGCGIYTIDQAGVKSLAGVHSFPVSYCW